MAYVIQCDVCGNVCKWDQAMSLTVQELDSRIDTKKVHLCPECYEKIKKFLKGSKEEIM
jgi:NAD-dependent SIR2 family protein deacetylase